MLEQGFKIAQDITRKNAHTFYLTSLFLPRKKRLASYTIYALCRLSDESVDDTHLSLSEKHRELADIQNKIDRAFGAKPLNDPLLIAFRHTINTYQIPKEYFDDLIQGMSMDLIKDRYKNFDELYLYAYRVAGVIGLIMTKIFGQKDPRTDQCAVNLGLALQLTNILRDIHEDSLRGRIYLPQDEIQNYGLNDEDIQKKVVNQQFKDLMSFQIKRTRDFFYKASLGLELITDPQCRFVAFLILELYAKILEQIEENNFDVYTKRAIVPAFKKMKTIASLAFRSLQKSYIFKQ